MMGVKVGIVLEKQHLDMIDNVVGARNRSKFVRFCINKYIMAATDEEIKRFRELAEELDNLERMRDIMSKEATFIRAFKCIRRSGIFIDQVREKIEYDYPPGVLSEEKKAIDFILRLREELTKELIKNLPQNGFEKLERKVKG